MYRLTVTLKLDKIYRHLGLHKSVVKSKDKAFRHFTVDPVLKIDATLLKSLAFRSKLVNKDLTFISNIFAGNKLLCRRTYSMQVGELLDFHQQISFPVFFPFPSRIPSSDLRRK